MAKQKLDAGVCTRWHCVSPSLPWVRYHIHTKPSARDFRIQKVDYYFIYEWLGNNRKLYSWIDHYHSGFTRETLEQTSRGKVYGASYWRFESGGFQRPWGGRPCFTDKKEVDLSGILTIYQILRKTLINWCSHPFPPFLRPFPTSSIATFYKDCFSNTIEKSCA